MIIEITKPYKKWKPGDKVDVTNELGAQLRFVGIAKIHGNQARFDYQPKEEATESEPQQVTINNYYIVDDEGSDTAEPKPNKTKSDSKTKK